MTTFAWLPTALAWLPSAVVALLTGHAAVNTRLLRRPNPAPALVAEAVSVLLPVRDEAHRVRACLQSLLGQRGVPSLSIVVLDDGSTDDTADAVREVAGTDPRVHMVRGGKPPPGWLGKPYACHQLAAHARGDVLVFVDADVVLRPHAIAAAVHLVRGVDLVSPYPRIVAGTAGERLVQPLLQWSWLTFLPLRAMERSARPSLAAAGGQFLVVTRSGYDRAGGHAGVRDAVLEDVALARAVKRAGGRIALADGSSLAACRMYAGWTELITGYGKSLWAAFGSPVAATAVTLALLLLYAVPPAMAAAAATTGAWSLVTAGLAGYTLGVAGRVVTGRSTGARIWPDACAHPLSVILFAWLLALSYSRRHRGVLRWKGRPVAVADATHPAPPRRSGG